MLTKIKSMAMQFWSVFAEWFLVIRAAIRARLVEDARAWHKFWSVRFSAAAAMVTAFLTLCPQWALDAWNSLPGEVKSLLPERYLTMIGVTLMVMSIIARVVRQSSVTKPTQAGGAQ